MQASRSHGAGENKVESRLWKIEWLDGPENPSEEWDRIE